MRTNKRRVSLTLEPSVITMAERLAEYERRSLSNLVEVLVERATHQQTRDSEPEGPALQRADGTGRRA